MRNMPQSGYYLAHPEKSREFNLLLLSKSSDAIEARRAINSLIVENEGFLKSFVRPWVKKNSPYDHKFLLQEARLALFEAIEKFDLHRGKSLRTYARFYLIKLKYSLYEEPLMSSIEDFVFEEDLPAFREDEAFTLTEKFDEAFRSVLTELEADVVAMYYLKGMKMQAIGLVKQCSTGRISTIIKKALPKLKSYLKAKGITPVLLELN